MKTILLIAASAVMMLASCSKQKEEAPTVRVTASVYVKNGESNYTVLLKIAPGISGTGNVVVSWKSDGGHRSEASKSFTMAGEQTYTYTTSVNKNTFPGVREIKIESFTATGNYIFSY